VKILDVESWRIQLTRNDDASAGHIQFDHRDLRFVCRSARTRGIQGADARHAVLPELGEAHERSLASLNNGRPPYAVKWKGCMTLKRGTRVDVVDQQAESTEIVIRGKHWFTDE